MRKPQTQEQWTRLQTLLQLACCDSARTNPLNHKTPSAETPNLKTLKALNPPKAQAPPPKKKKNPGNLDVQAPRLVFADLMVTSTGHTIGALIIRIWFFVRNIL